MKPKDTAQKIVDGLSESGYAVDEALKILQDAENVIRASRGHLYKEIGKTALKNALRAESKNYSSSGKSGV